MEGRHQRTGGRRGFLFLLAAFAVGLVAIAAAQSASSDLLPPPPAAVQWSVDGSPVGEWNVAPNGAREFHAAWTTGGAALVWTKSGNVNSGAMNSPGGANGVHVVWKRWKGYFTAAFWSQNGTDVAAIPIAEGSNGFYIKLTGASVFDSADWSKHRGVLRRIVPEPGANDVHFKLLCYYHPC
jgi:hypothetical protein